MTYNLALVFGGIFGMLSVVSGAFGAHALKEKLTTDQLKNFETGVKYQMYHAIVLLVIGSNTKTTNSAMVWCFIIGTILFSFSIYGLVLSDAKEKKLRFLGPITPIGGTLLVIGWGLLLFSFLA